MTSYRAAELLAGDLVVPVGATEADLLELWLAAYARKFGREPSGPEREAALEVLRRKLGCDATDPPASASGLAWACVPELVQLRCLVDGEGEPCSRGRLPHEHACQTPAPADRPRARAQR